MPVTQLQQSQARGAGAVLSFTTDEFALSKHVAEATELFRIAVSFGSVNSTISLPGSMSHASVPVELQAARALPERPGASLARHRRCRRPARRS